MKYPEELVELADQMRKLGVLEFKYGDAYVRFSPSAFLRAEASPEPDDKRTAREQGKEIPLPDAFDGISVEELLG